MYKSGVIVEEYMKLALLWMRQSAVKGYAPAQHQFGIWYRKHITGSTERRIRG
jgi:hypothetical protein